MRFRGIPDASDGVNPGPFRYRAGMNMDSKVWIVLVVVGLGLLGGGYVAGRYASPERVVVTERVREVEKQVVVKTVDTDRILNALKDIKVQKDVHTVRIIEKAPDGTTKTTVTSDDKSQSESKTQVQEKEHRVETKLVEKLVFKEREVSKTVERAKPNWSLALMPGFDLAGALGQGQSYSLLPTLPVRHLMLGASIEHRLIGPLFSGIWANTAGAGGLTLRVEF